MEEIFPHPEWLKFRKGLRLSVQNENSKPGFGGEQDSAGFGELRSRPALRAGQHRRGSVTSLLRMGSLLHHPASGDMALWFLQRLGKAVGLNTVPLPPHINFLSSALERRGKVLCEDQNLGNAAKGKKILKSGAKTTEKMSWR